MFKAAIRLVLFISCTLLSWTAVAKPVEVFTVLGPEGEGVLRWITSEASCPSVRWDNHKPVTMKLRTGAIEVPVRVTLQSDQKASVFDQITCEAKWPRGVKFAQVKGRKLNAPKYAYQRILIIADTGCRMKASENAFQSCNDLEKWPFAKVAKSASEKIQTSSYTLAIFITEKVHARPLILAAKIAHGDMAQTLGEQIFLNLRNPC